MRDVPREGGDRRGMPRGARIPLIERPDEPGENPPRQRRVLPSAFAGRHDQPRHVREGEDADEDEDGTGDSSVRVDGSCRHRQCQRDQKRWDDPLQNGQPRSKRLAIHRPHECRQDQHVEDQCTATNCSKQDVERGCLVVRRGERGKDCCGGQVRSSAREYIDRKDWQAVALYSPRP
jgi:hypothetical protein